jgi:hypothetical protein
MSAAWDCGATPGKNLTARETELRHQGHAERMTEIYTLDREKQLKEDPPRIWETRFQAGLDSSAGRIARPGTTSVEKTRRKKIRQGNQYLKQRLDGVEHRTFKKRVPLLPGCVCACVRAGMRAHTRACVLATTPHRVAAWRIDRLPIRCARLLVACVDDASCVMPPACGTRCPARPPAATPHPPPPQFADG